MSYILQFYKAVSVLSIDVAVGAIAGALFFSKIFEVQISFYGLITLGLSVWCIYTLDHLVDAFKTKSEASSERHRFHQQHFRKLLIALIFCLLFNVLFITSIQKAVFNWGIVLLVIVAFYLFCHQQLKFFKEILVALIYTVGIMLPSISLTTTDINEQAGFLILMYFLTALINLILFSWLGIKQDQTDKHISLMNYLNESSIKYLLAILFSIQCVLTLFQVLNSTPFVTPLIILFLMNLILYSIYLFKEYFIQYNRYRYIGDGIFFLPFMYWLI